MEDSIICRFDYAYDIFISYSSKDIDFVISVVKMLNAYNYRVWRDADILSRYPGDYYNEHIEDGISNSALILYFHSENSIESSCYVQKKELPFAIELHKQILTYRCYGTEQSLPSILKNRQEIALLKRPTSNVIDGLFSIRVAVMRNFGELIPDGNYIKLETNPQIWKPEDIYSELSGNIFTLPIPESRRDILSKIGFSSLKEDSAGRYEQLCKFITDSGYITNAPLFIENISCEVADYFLQQKEQGKTIFNGPNIGVESVISDRTDDGEEVHKLYIKLYRSNYFTFKVTSRIYEELRKRDRTLFSVKTTRDLQRIVPFLCSLGMGGFIKAKHNGETRYLWVKRSTECEAGSLYHFSYDETVAVKDINKDTVTDKETINLYTTLYRGLREELGIRPQHLSGEGGIFELGLILTDKRIELEFLSFEEITEEAQENFMHLMWAAEDSQLEIDRIYFWTLKDYKRMLTDQLLTPEALELIKRMEVREKYGRQ